MPLKTTAKGETVGMRLIDAKLAQRGLGTLARFIAKRRTPGEDWTSYEEIAYELQALTGERVSRAGVEKWAVEKYGIPRTRRSATAKDRAAYLAVVERYLRR